MKRTKEDAELTKKKLLETAFREFLETGIKESKLEVIAEKAGVTRGAFYWHYKDKADLLDAILDYKDLESLKISSELVKSKGDPFVKLKKLVALNFPDIKNKKKEKNFIRMKVELYNHWSIKGDKRKVAEHFMNMCRTLLIQCRQQGILKDNVNPAIAAHTILSLIAGSYARFNSLPEKLRSISVLKKIAMDYLKLIHK